MATVEVTFDGSGVRLAGSLAVPAGARENHCPGVVLVGGSGPADRDNDTFFPPIRRELTAAGIAVLSYDKRGVGSSSGDWRAAGLDDLAADAAAALAFLRAQPEVRAGTAGLFGHSEGGWVVLRAAARHTDPAWLITNSCPGMTPAIQDRYALVTALRQAGVSASVRDRETARYDALIEAGRRDAGYAEATRLVDPSGSPHGLAGYWADVDERVWAFLKRKQDHDPIPDALALRCPHLAVFGGADELVPVAESIRLFAAAACHPDRHADAGLTVQVFPHANHRAHVDGGTRPAPGYLDTLIRWINGRPDD